MLDGAWNSCKRVKRNQCPPLNFPMWVTEDFYAFLIDDRVGLPSRQHLPILGILRVCIEDRWEILANKKWNFEISINLVTALWFLFKSEICVFNETSLGMRSFRCVFVFTHCQTFSSTLFLDLSMLEIWNIVWLCWILAGLWQLFFKWRAEFFPLQIPMLEATVIFAFFTLSLQHRTTNDCYSQKNLKGIFKVNFLYIINCFYLWISHHRETFFLLNINLTKEEKCF